MKTEELVSHLVKPNMLEHGDVVKFKTAEGYVKTSAVVSFPGMPFSAKCINIGTRTKWETLHVTNVLELAVGPGVTGRECTMMFNAAWDEEHGMFKLYEQNVGPSAFKVEPAKRTGNIVTLNKTDVVAWYRPGLLNEVFGKPSGMSPKTDRPTQYHFAVMPYGDGPSEWIHARDVIRIGKPDEETDSGLLWAFVEHDHTQEWDVYHETTGPKTYIHNAMIADATISLRTTDATTDATVTDYKGHKNLAEMVKGHLSPLAKGLRTLQEHAVLNGDGDDASYWDHELNALLDIEKAIRADLNVEPWAESVVEAEMPKLCGYPGCIKPNCDGVGHGFATEEERDRHFVKHGSLPNKVTYSYLHPDCTHGDAPCQCKPAVAFAEPTEPQPTPQEAREQAWGGTITPDPVAGLHTQRTALEFDTHISVSLHTLRGILTDAVNVYERGAYDSVEDLVSARMYVVALTHKTE